MLHISNLFIGERKDLEKQRNKLLETVSSDSKQVKVTEISEKSIPHYYVILDAENIAPKEWADSVVGTNVRLYWCAEDEENKKFFVTESDEADGLLIKSHDSFETFICDTYGNVLPQGTRVNLMFEYINVDAFIKWLNFKLRNDGIYEVTEKNVFPYLQELEVQYFSRKSVGTFFMLPAFSTRTGEYEAYKFSIRDIDGVDTVCF